MFNLNVIRIKKNESQTNLKTAPSVVFKNAFDFSVWITHKHAIIYVTTYRVFLETSDCISNQRLKMPQIKICIKYFIIFNTFHLIKSFTLNFDGVLCIWKQYEEQFMTKSAKSSLSIKSNLRKLEYV